MKNKLLVGLFLMIATIFSMTIEVRAVMIEQFYTETKLDNIWIVREESSGIKHRERARVIRRRSDNMLAYCVEPWQDLVEDMMVEGTNINHASALNISQATWERVSLLAYYGYGYQDHTDIKWYSITQLLIWRAIDPSSDFYYVNINDNSRWDDRFASEIAEIERLIANHYKSPNFGANQFNGIIGQTINLTDSNNILNKFDVSSDNNVKIEKNGNQLSLTPNEIGDLTILLENSDKMLTSPPVVYPNPSSQDIMVRGMKDPVRLKLRLNVSGGKVTIHKLDNDNKTNIAGSIEATLSGAKYGIFNEAGNQVSTVITGKDGTIQSDFLPSLGHYTLRELEASIGYELDRNEYPFDITMEQLFPNVTVYEQIIKRPIRIGKFYAQENTGSLIPEKNILFKFYDKNNQEIASVETGEDGYAELELPFGKYTGKQITTTENYEKVEDFEITIDENSPSVIRLSFSNAQIRAKLKVVKIDEETKEIIKASNIRFKIKNLDTNEYVCQTITYPNIQTICEYETTEDGILYTPFQLEAGNYKLEEVDQSLNGYIWNTEGLEFSIGENSEIMNDEFLGPVIEIRFPNRQAKGKIEIKKKGEKLNITDGTFEYVEIDLKDVVYEIRAKEDIIINNHKYYSKGELVATLITDENGFASIDGIPLGTYTIQEISSNLNNMVDSKIYELSLTYQDQYTELIIVNKDFHNYLPKGELKFLKTDLATGKGIPNVKFEIYYVNEEEEKDVLIFSGLTDSAGEITITDLFVGKFYIVETEVAEGYKISDEKVFFEIKENGEIVKANMTNMRIDVPDTLSNSYFMLLPISLFIVGIILLVISMNNKKNYKG